MVLGSYSFQFKTMYVLNNIDDAIYHPLTISNFTYFFLSRKKKSLYIPLTSYYERERGKKEEEHRKREAIAKWRAKEAQEAQGWENQRGAMFNGWKAKEEAKKEQRKHFNDSDHNCHHNDHKASWGHDVGPDYTNDDDNDSSDGDCGGDD